MKCSNCTQPALIHIEWKGKSYCKNHFKRYFLGQVGKVVNKYDVRGSVAVALSGGKDSAVALETLTHFKQVNLKPFFIDLGIKGFSEASLDSAKKLAKDLNLNLDVVDLKERYGFDLPKIHRRQKKSMCSLCGLVKRYLMNKYAFENRFDWLATGHNLSDVVTFSFNNLANVQPSLLRSMKPTLEGREKYKLVAKLKPLYWLKDEEVLKYAQINDVMFNQVVCPHPSEAPTLELKSWLHELDSTMPGILRNYVKSFIKIGDQIEEDEETINNCERCGYAASTRTCSFCRMMRMQNRAEN